MKLLKFLLPAVIKPLTLVINQSLATGIFPDKLKIAKVMPFYKKDDITLMANYRPVSLLTSTSKYLKRWYSRSCMNISTNITCSTRANTVFARNTPQKWPA